MSNCVYRIECTPVDHEPLVTSKLFLVEDLKLTCSDGGVVSTRPLPRLRLLPQSQFIRTALVTEYNCISSSLWLDFSKATDEATKRILVLEAF